MVDRGWCKIFNIRKWKLITYKEVFPLIKNNKLWIGRTPLSVDIVFNSPEKIDPNDYPASSIKKIDGEFF